MSVAGNVVKTYRTYYYASTLDSRDRKIIKRRRNQNGRCPTVRTTNKERESKETTTDTMDLGDKKKIYAHLRSPRCSSAGDKKIAVCTVEFASATLLYDVYVRARTHTYDRSYRVDQ